MIGARRSEKSFQISRQSGWITAEIGNECRRLIENGPDNAFLQPPPRWIHNKGIAIAQFISEQVCNIASSESASLRESVVQGIPSSLFDGSGIQLQSENSEFVTRKGETDCADAAIGVDNGSPGQLFCQPPAQQLDDALGLWCVDLEKGGAAESKV